LSLSIENGEHLPEETKPNNNFIANAFIR